MKTARFDYLFAGDSEVLYTDLEKRTGQRVRILSQELSEPGMNYYEIEFSDGHIAGCNDDELSDWKED